MGKPLFSRNKAPEPPSTNEMARPSEVTVPYYWGETSYGFGLPEYNVKLAGRRGTEIYDRMRRSSSHVRSSLRMMKAPVLTSQYYMQPYSNAAYDQEVSKFVWWSLNKPERPLLDTLREALGFLDFGHYAFEKVWEVCDWTPPYNADEDRKPIPRTVVTWDYLAPIHPVKINQFYRDGANHISAINYGNSSKEIPIEKLIFFPFEAEGDDPYGMSVLRSAYQNWFYLEWLTKLDAIQKERHAVGIPEIDLPVSFKPSDVTRAYEMGQNMRSNEKGVIVKPPGWEVKFAQLQGLMVDVVASMHVHKVGIQEAMLTQFLSLGTSESGSRAVGDTQSTAFDDATRYVTDFLRGVINAHIRELVNYNYDVDGYPELRARRFDETRFRSLGVGLRNLGEPGFLTPTPELEEFITDYTDLPAPSAEAKARSAADRIAKPAPSGKGAGGATNADGSRVGSGEGNPVA
jgi:hypothetical protein